MTRQAFTVHGFFTKHRLGFESTHLSRQSIFKDLGIPHTVIFSDPFIFISNWVEHVEGIGYEVFKNVLLEQSSIALDRPCLTEEQAVALIDIKEPINSISFSKDNYVAAIHFSNESYHFTSTVFLHQKDKKITLYDRGGEVCQLVKDDSYWQLTYPDGTKKSNWDLIVEWLAEHSNRNDIFITDFSSDHPIVLKKFIQNTGRQLQNIIHYNILSSKMLFKFPRWCRLLTASERLTERLLNLDIETTFVPPIAVNQALVKRFSKVTDYCLVGSKFPIKRIEIAIQVFESLAADESDLHLTIYGGLPEGIELEDLPANITYAGHVTDVPYWKHEGYISCSESECFANAMVEASSYGLVAVVSDVDLAHRYYKEKSPNGVHLFTDQKDLRDTLLILSQQEAYSCHEIAERYLKEKVIANYISTFQL